MILIIAILLLPCLLFAKRITEGRVKYVNVTLAWDYGDMSVIDGFRLYSSSNNLPFSVEWNGRTLGTTLSLVVGTPYRFAVTAFKGSTESLPSNILEYTVPRPTK